jgi:hypothetical protein
MVEALHISPCTHHYLNRDRRTAEWQDTGTRLATRLHRDRVNADIAIERAD